MSISLMVRVAYLVPRDPEPKQTYIDVPADDSSLLGDVPQTVLRAVGEWARLTGYRAIDWEIKTVYRGRADFFRGSIPAL